MLSAFTCPGNDSVLSHVSNVIATNKTVETMFITNKVVRSRN